MTDLMRPAVRRIAMWSGPRNISTAMMRAWENRPDTAVVDEPLYGAYLAATGLDHPGRETVLAAMETDWRKVVARLVEDAPAPVYYQKHMAHHLLPGMERDWVLRLENVFLIRDPAQMIASYVNKRDSVALADLGLAQQVELYDYVAAELGQAPPVIDAADVLADPPAMLGALCERLGLPFFDAMLAWPAGRRASDGVWAPWWYDAVERSTGFAPYRPKTVALEGPLADLEAQCRPLYQRLWERRLRA